MLKIVLTALSVLLETIIIQCPPPKKKNTKRNVRLETLFEPVTWVTAQRPIECAIQVIVGGDRFQSIKHRKGHREGTFREKDELLSKFLYSFLLFIYSQSLFVINFHLLLTFR